MVRASIVAGLVLLGIGALFFALRPGPSASEQPRERVLDAEIAGGEMEPGELSVIEGDAVTLRVSSDEPVEIHLHGYDIEEEIPPGEAVDLRFEADLTGRFEIEDHGTDEVLGVLLVRPR